MDNCSQLWTEEILAIITNPSTQAGTPQVRSIIMLKEKQQKLFIKNFLQAAVHSQTASFQCFSQ
jgi:hypothetical protein